MNREGGALRIFLYNWPAYLGTWAAAGVVLLLVPRSGSAVSWVLWIGAVVSVVWSIVSLVVSFANYDRSALFPGRWARPLLGPDIGTWASIHAGLDVEVDFDGVLPGRCVARLDVFDRRVMSSRSIVRARARTPSARGASRCSPSALALADEACDAIVVAFTAHEIRDRAAREAFFRELWRCSRPGGKVLIVEHFRDVANFLAFGPGFLHFVSRREWLRLSAQARLAVCSETAVTPWVTALTLQRPR